MSAFLGVKRTSHLTGAMSAFDPKRTSKFVFRVNPNRASAPQHCPAFDFLDRKSKMVSTGLRRNVPLLLVGSNCMFSLGPPSHPESKGPGEVAALPVGPRLCCFL